MVWMNQTGYDAIKHIPQADPVFAILIYPLSPHLTPHCYFPNQ
jgi:hypothetical protein